MYYESFGAGRPIVFLPGWGGDAGEGRDIHEPVFEGRTGWRRIYVDPPGTGKSPAVPGITDQDGMLAAIAVLIDEVVGTERFALAGTSAGGLHSRGIVQRDPSRILGLLLRVPGIIVDRAKRDLPTDEHLTKTSEWHDKQRRYYDVTEEQADLEFLGRIQADVRTYALSEDPAARFDGPTLIVTARQDTMTGYADAWSVLDDYPRATYAVLDQEDHFLPVRRHAVYRALVADWLDRMEEHLDA
ncbi:pimeloyl-ACP methyl ester carboxylesterase [Kribbella steppae]|uniref:Pimeloyl-ACP methyl ester carboxylesterase n=1 Tax=Kribbella steppae TaxID=2512223 RepID=A0A4R2HTX7_9ACTN|nr:alpha/beta hydrolase [Kribbella steppae]TCO34028.1 pimeloyl-ACP methyl ester carboxylesterase [Kribbella steppae]